jgi:pimeloyl-ACP methyl ester carboxylesterase
MDVPTTRYTKLGDDRIAFQVVGDADLDLLYVPGMLSTLDWPWEWPPTAAFIRALASFSRLIFFDRRGCGASDPVPGDRLPTWEEWADEARAVLDAVGSERAAILGAVDAGPAAILFAATQPERHAP